jgi:hypothetical protein
MSTSLEDEIYKKAKNSAEANKKTSYKTIQYTFFNSYTEIHYKRKLSCMLYGPFSNTGKPCHSAEILVL